MNHPSAGDSTPLMDDVAALAKQVEDGPVEPPTTPTPHENSPFGQPEGVAPLPSNKKQQQQRYRPAVVNNKAGAKRRVSRVESLRNLFLRSSRPSPSSSSPSITPAVLMAPAAAAAAIESIQPQQEVITVSPSPVPSAAGKMLADAPDVIQEAQKNILTRGGSNNRMMQPNRSISLENVSAGGIMETPDVAGTASSSSSNGNSKKSHFPYSFIRSRLHRPLLSSCEAASVPQTKSGELAATASCDDLMTETARQSHPDLQLASIRYRSVVSVSQEDGPFKLVRRKRSFSLAALPISSSEATQTHMSARSEESGYESDSTRNGSESPRRTSADNGKPDPASIHVSFVSSLKSADETDRARQTAPTPTQNHRPVEADKFSLDGDFEGSPGQQHSRCCNCRCSNNQQADNGKQQSRRMDVQSSVVQLRAMETGGSRSRHLPVISDATQASRYARSSSLDRKKWLQSSVLVEIGGHNDTETLLLDRQAYSSSSTTTTVATTSLPPGLAAQHLSQPPRPSSSFAYAPLYNQQQQQRQFKMLRLVKGETGELGIYIKKKPSPDSGSVGYVIAGIEPGALAHR